MTGAQLWLLAFTVLQRSQALIYQLAQPSTHRMGSSLQSRTKSNGLDQTKRIVFIRHGCTYMNEYLGRGNEFGCPNFSDVFTSPEDLEKYRDSKLSPLGVNQARALSRQLTKELDWKGRQRSTWRFLGMGMEAEESYFQASDLDLIVVSPLTRALQTYDLALKPVLSDSKRRVLAQPLAAERVYLISDQGTHRSELERKWGTDICFESCFRANGNELIEEWWFGLDDQRSRKPSVPTGINVQSYKEWRPSSQNQQYACAAEDDISFEIRMRKLYQWLDERPESMIAIVCHWGVINWFLDSQFENCELRVVPFKDVQPKSLEREIESIHPKL